MKRNVNVYIPNGKSVFYANFRTKAKDPATGLTRTMQVNRSTGSPSRATAQSIGNKMRDDAAAGLFDALPKFRDDCPTLAVIFARYRAASKVQELEAVINSFLIVTSEALGIPKERIPEQKVSVLTQATMLAFRDNPAQTRSATTTNALMRRAKSLFCRRAMEYYQGIQLPDLSGWLDVSFLADRSDKRFRRIPQDILDSMDKAAPKLLLDHSRTLTGSAVNEYRNAWGVYLLMRRCGLRNSEVENLRWEWIDKRGDRYWIALNKRTYWSPKGSAGDVPLADDLHAMLVAEFGPDRAKRAAESPDPIQPADDYLLAGTLTDRKEGALRIVSTFVRGFLPDRSKSAYELRKQWGSEMARLHGIETAAKLLRHQDIKTAWSHYFDDLKLSSVAAL